jgi:hypothetical protein
MRITPSASHLLDGGVNQALWALEAGMHVALIATFDLKTCQVSDTVEEVLSCSELQAFDYIPVCDRDNIVGVLHRPYPGEKQTVGLLREVMQPIHESMLIPANASLLSFVEYADKIPSVDRKLLRSRSSTLFPREPFSKLWFL